MKTKFKAFIPNLKWFVPVTEINFPYQFVEVDLSDGNGDTSHYSWSEVILSQYIGLKDQDEQEIYAGNVVTIEVETTEGFYRTDTFVVQWVEEAAQFGLERRGIVHLELNAYLPYSKIIGNVYEHPELIS